MAKQNHTPHFDADAAARQEALHTFRAWGGMLVAEHKRLVDEDPDAAMDFGVQFALAFEDTLREVKPESIFLAEIDRRRMLGIL